MLATHCYEWKFVNSRQLMQAYYMATAVFLLLDVFADINIRIAFFENAPGLKWTYYLVCFGLAGLVIWRPAWTTLVSVVESLAVLIALILSMGTRVVLVSDAVLETGGGFVSIEEIINFVISGYIAYFAWVRGMQELTGRR